LVASSLFNSIKPHCHCGAVATEKLPSDVVDGIVDVVVVKYKSCKFNFAILKFY